MPVSQIRAKILVVDDDPLVLDALHQTFLDTYDVILAASGVDALDQITHHADLAAIILDIRMAKMDGFETARRIRELPMDAPIIFHTGYPGEYSSKQIEAEKPYDYVGKNEDPSRLQHAVRTAVRSSLFRIHTDKLIEYAESSFGMVGKSLPMLEVYRQIDEVGPKDKKVMILGATGTGKELVAKAIHQCSPRAEHRIAFFSCSYKATDMVEDELFGHVKGGYTGAVADRMGVFQYADGGTVFLDEIGELDLNTQTKLLRVLESGEIMRIGSPDVLRVNVRVICATNADLQAMVNAGRFRPDLYYRLKGIVIHLPPLKERREDIPGLIDFFTTKYCEESNIEPKYFEQSARELLIEYDWPGNVRDLKETVESLIASTPSYFIARPDVEKRLNFGGIDHAPEVSFDDQVRDFKRILIVKSLDRHAGNISKVAREFGKDPANFRKQIESLGISLG